MGLWLAMHAAPFMPAQRFVSYFSNPARALDWDWSSGAFAGFLAGYLLVGTVLRSLLRPSSFWKLFSACALLSVLARIVFRDQRLLATGMCRTVGGAAAHLAGACRARADGVSVGAAVGGAGVCVLCARAVRFFRARRSSSG